MPVVFASFASTLGAVAERRTPDTSKPDPVSVPLCGVLTLINLTTAVQGGTDSPESPLGVG